MEIRPLTRRDRDDWQKLWRGYQQFYGVDLQNDEDRLLQTLLTSQDDGPFCLLAIDDAGTVGLAQYLFHNTTWSGAPRCYLNDLFTLESARGKGVGRALIQEVDRRSKERGASQTYWLTQTFNQQARKLYDRVATETPFIKYVM